MPPCTGMHIGMKINIVRLCRFMQYFPCHAIVCKSSQNITQLHTKALHTPAYPCTDGPIFAQFGAPIAIVCWSIKNINTPFSGEKKLNIPINIPEVLFYKFDFQSIMWHDDTADFRLAEI